MNNFQPKVGDVYNSNYLGHNMDLVITKINNNLVYFRRYLIGNGIEKDEDIDTQDVEWELEKLTIVINTQLGWTLKSKAPDIEDNEEML